MTVSRHYHKAVVMVAAGLPKPEMDFTSEPADKSDGTPTTALCPSTDQIIEEETNVALDLECNSNTLELKVASFAASLEKRNPFLGLKSR